MTNLGREKQISAAVERLKAWKPERIILFGSCARGDDTPQSDLDFLVVVPDESYNRELRFEMAKSLRDLETSVDLVVASVSTIDRKGYIIGLVYREALLEGKLLYAA